MSKNSNSRKRAREAKMRLEQESLDGPRHVVVIGGGVAGLATATLLAQQGHKVTLVEKNAEVGGRAGSWAQDGFRWDTGPSWYLMPEVFDQYYRLLGKTVAEELELVRLDPAYAVWGGPHHANRPVLIRSGRAEVQQLFESLEAGAGTRVGRYLDSASKVYQLALRRFLYNRFDPPGIVSAFARPDVLMVAPRLVPQLIGTLHTYVARRFSHPTLQKILDYPAVFLGSSPYRTPAMYHLMSHLDLDDGVYYPQGGFTTFVESLRQGAEQAGVTILTDTEAEAIKTMNTHSMTVYTAKPSGHIQRFADSLRWTIGPAHPVLHSAWRGIGALGRALFGARSRSGLLQPDEVVTGVRVRTNSGNPYVLPASAVVGAYDLHHLERRLLPPRLRTYGPRYWKKRTPGPGALVLLLGVRGELPQLQHHNLLFAEQWKSGFSAIFGADPYIPDPASLYICKPSATDPSVAPPGHENLFVLVPGPADVVIDDGSIQNPGALGFGGASESASPASVVAARVVAQISEWTGIEDLAERIVVQKILTPADFAADVHAWRGTALGQAHTLRQSAMFRTRNRSRKVGGLFYAGSSTLPGIGLPMCLISAELATRAVANLRGDGPLSRGDLNPQKRS